MKNFKIGKNTVYYILGAIGLLVVVVGFSFNDSAPGGILYGLDRSLENISINNSTEAKIYKNLDLASERLEETKLTSRDSDLTQQLITDFGNNLDLIVAEYTNAAENKTLSEEKLASIGIELVKDYSASYGRTLGVRIESTSTKGVKTALNKGYKSISRFANDIFDAAILNLENPDYEFELFAQDMLANKVREVAQSVKYMEEDTAIVTPQLNPEQLEELTNIVEPIRQEFFAIRDKIGQKSNREYYTELKEVQRKIDEEFSPNLVRLSKESAGNLNIKTEN